MEDAAESARWGKVPAWWLGHGEMDADGFSVMAAMATYADRDGLCDPSQATLARKLRRSRPWVNRVVARLAAIGLLEKTGRSRVNGGTTSCLYRLAMSPAGGLPGAAGGSPRRDGPRRVGDGGRHPGDTSQPDSEQNNARPPRARPREGNPEAAEVPRGWTPGPGEVSEAERLCPGADLDSHTAHFVAKCRAKGYRYAPDALGDAWLSWLLEDRRADAGPSRGGRKHAARPGPADRLAAWARAASGPGA